MDCVKKTISIIIPAFNMEAYLAKCCESLLIPRPERVEALIVNDGSTDGTLSVANDLAQRYPDVFRVVNKPNGHYGSCINAALPLCRGAFVKVLDADDTFDTAEFAGFVDALEASESAGDGVDVALTDYVEVAPDGSVRCRRRADRFGYRMHAIAYRTSMVRDSGYRQSEGVAYTDNEWALIPRSGARLTRRFPFCVYRYLVGRPGQSIDQNSQAANYRDELHLARRMMAELPLIADDMKQHAVACIAHAYMLAAIFANDDGRRETLAEFEREAVSSGCARLAIAESCKMAAWEYEAGRFKPVCRSYLARRLPKMLFAHELPLFWKIKILLIVIGAKSLLRPLYAMRRGQ